MVDFWRNICRLPTGIFAWQTTWFCHNRNNNIGAPGTRAAYARFESNLIEAYNAIISYVQPVIGDIAESDAIFSDLVITRDKLNKTQEEIDSSVQVPTTFLELIQAIVRKQVVAIQ